MIPQAGTGTLTGIIPVLEVPFHDDGRIDLKGFHAVVGNVRAAGVPAVMFPGFASEFHKLDSSERDMLGAALAEHDVPAIVSIPDHATYHAVRNAAAAVERGAAAVNVLPPHQLGPSRDAVLDHLREVLWAVAPIPVVVQYAPAQTGTALDAATLRTLAAEHANLAMVKVESVPPGRLIAALADPAGPGRPLAAMVGYAGLQMIDALRRGASGVQPGCSFPEPYLEIWRRWAHGDQTGAEALHTRMLPYLSYWMQGVELIVAVEKEISRRRGWFASAHCRAPAHRLDHEELAMIDRFCAEFLPEAAR
ncbi:dihydrodipicolinate synthase family protein [Actinomadura violacea]|uniref:Dihydrodipicolinate synthase family protein n=1 Tax=Actinomadura violacea TaxID=2819934 RepID=A0ABS3S8S3_9ACTN|nr:dihydrodipicolinate synthase family protein [Actinomadura violacea]MBO2465410.1 dihydrodipicolinate synthase family protein [Actinomadura violacea]